MLCIIVRGLPGSGKTTHHRKNYPGATVVSADKFFGDGSGEYKPEEFDPAKLGQAHDFCFRQFLDAIDRQDEVVVVDNTNISAIEYAPYHRYASIKGYTVQIVTFKVDPAVCFQRQTHGAPERVFAGMAARLDAERMPPWYNHTIIEQ